jgi:Asp-tRNA(Asn)/Glu-tRNA(Gln) amidotransferase C subunit
MGERAIIDKGMETLENIGQGDSSTFIMPQELTSLVGRYGQHLTGSDTKTKESLNSLDFDEETREMLGLDDIEDILGQIDEAAELDTEAMEQEAEKIMSGDTEPDIQSADDVVADADEEMGDVEMESEESG